MAEKSRQIILEFPDNDKELQVLYMAHLMAQNRQPNRNSKSKPLKWKIELVGQDGEKLIMRVVRIDPLELAHRLERVRTKALRPGHRGMMVGPWSP